MAVLRILRGEDDSTVINSTFPKAASPEERGQFQSISLCNVIYKIASKTLPNRLKIVLPEVTSEEQSNFVPGRLITDNIIIVYECLYFMKRKRVRDLRCCAIKLDMKKGYARVQCKYLKVIMLRLGFHRLYVDMVMRLVTTLSFLVFFNGECLGDPIFPLAVEGFPA